MKYAGIDWARRDHRVCVVADDGSVRARLSVTDDAKGYEEIIRTIGDPQGVRIAIERKDLRLVDFLISMGYEVFFVPPGRVRNLRDRYRSGLSKSDDFDSYVLAQTMRLDRDIPIPVKPVKESYQRVRALWEMRGRLVKRRLAMASQFEELARVSFPEFMDAFPDLVPSAFRFFLEHPSKQKTDRLSDVELVRAIKASGFTKKSSQERIRKALRGPRQYMNPAVAGIKAAEAIILARDILRLYEDTKEIEKELEKAMSACPEAGLFQRLPGIGIVGASGLVSLFSSYDFQDYHAVQAFIGVVPETIQSGEFSRARFRFACHKGYRDLMVNIAFTFMHRNPLFRAVYRRLREEGKTHSHALRIMAKTLAKIFYAIWRDQRPYDENIFLAARERRRYGVPASP